MKKILLKQALKLKKVNKTTILFAIFIGLVIQYPILKKNTCDLRNTLDDIKQQIEIDRAKNEELRKSIDDSIQCIINENNKWTEIELYANASSKTYMDGNTITDATSSSYALLQTLHVDYRGNYVDNDNYIAIAISNVYATVGQRLKITLDTNIILRCIVTDIKSDKNVDDRGVHLNDGSMIEFVVNEKTAYSYYGGGNGMPNNGNYNNHKDYRGKIIRIEKENI